MDIHRLNSVLHIVKAEISEIIEPVSLDSLTDHLMSETKFALMTQLTAILATKPKAEVIALIIEQLNAKELRSLEASYRAGEVK